MLMEKLPLDQLMRYVQDQRQIGIIYCNSRSKVEDTAASCKSRGISAAAYHAGLETTQREVVETPARRSADRGGDGGLGMGINKPNVRFVVHFRYSAQHRIPAIRGDRRAGRDGSPAAMLFYDPADMAWPRRCSKKTRRAATGYRTA